MKVSNREFLTATFGDAAPLCHVTDFTYDPGDIPAGKGGHAWLGGKARVYGLRAGSNQYFTISVFDDDKDGNARRKKNLFKAAHVIVLDDVKEKLKMEEVRKLPKPAWAQQANRGNCGCTGSG